MLNEYEDEEERIIHDPGERIPDSDELPPELQLSKQEQRWVALGALKGALLIGGIYLAGLALIIILLLAVWN